MNQDSLQQATDERPHYSEKTPANYFEMLDSEMRSSFTDLQREAVTRLLAEAIPKPGPKLVDLRFWVDWFAYRFYVVLFVGKDRRRRDRPELSEPMARKGNAITALMLLIGLNLLISIFVLLLAYLIKAAVGYSLLPNSHTADQLQKTQPGQVVERVELQRQAPDSARIK